jgi:predicted transcriptional regulator
MFLGYLSGGSRFHLPINYFGYHFAFYGVTGSGKTRLAMKLAIETENSGIKLIILDVEGEWKNLIPYFKGKTEYYATERNLKVNPFELGDIGLIRLLLKETIFKGIEVEYQELSPQMNYVLDKCILKSKSIPELIDNVTYYQGRDLPFKLVNLDRTKTALLVRLEPYRTNPALKEIFYCNSSSLDLNKLGDRNILFDFHSLEMKVAYRVELRLLYNVITVAYLRLALARRITNKISHMFVAEEAQQLVPKILRKLVVTDTWTTTEFATRLRKRGESLVIISQSPSNIENDIRKNAQNNFYFRLQSPEDIKVITGSLGLTWYDKVDYFTQIVANLKQREAIIKTPLVEEPFIIEAPEVKLSRITKKELKKYMPKVQYDFSEEEQEFLENINIDPFVPMTGRRRALGWDKRKYSKIVRRLIENNVIKKARVPMGKGRPLVLYQLKDKKPSIKHEYYVYWIVKELANKGYILRTSKVGPDITIPSHKVAINVELGKSDIEKNIKLASKDFDRVIICSDNKKLLESISIPEKLRKGKDILKSLVVAVPELL